LDLYEVVVIACQLYQEEPPDDEVISPSQKERQRIMSENLHGGDIQNMRILSYMNKAPGAPDVRILVLFCSSIAYISKVIVSPQ
jgi:hypothetical protein